MLASNAGMETLAFSSINAFNLIGASLTFPIDMVIILTKNIIGLLLRVSSALIRSVRTKERSSCMGCK